MMKKLHGSITALITPFTNGTAEVDYDAFHDLVERQLDLGTDGIVVAGTTGEHSSLSDKELKNLFNVAVDAVHGRVPVIAGCGDSTADRAIAISHIAQDAKVDATLHIGGMEAVRHAEDDPVSIQKALCRHFHKIHDNTTLPIVMYTVQARTGVSMRVRTITNLSELPRVIGVKDCDTHLEDDRLAKLKRHIKRDDFSILTGEDVEALNNLIGGGDGCISVTANIAPALCAALQAFWRTGNTERSREIHQELMPLHEAMFQPGTKNPQSVKYAASLFNLATNSFRENPRDLAKSLKPITREQEHVVNAAIHHAGIRWPEHSYA